MLGPDPDTGGRSEEGEGAGYRTRRCLKVQITSELRSMERFSNSRFHIQAHAAHKMRFCSPKQNNNNKRNPRSFPPWLLLLCNAAGRSDSVLNVTVEAVNVLSNCVCTSHLHANIKRLKRTYFKLGSLKAISKLSIEPELLLSLMQIKVKLFSFLRIYRKQTCRRWES